MWLVFRVLIVTIRNLGKCPCPQCLILKYRTQLLATESGLLQHRLLSRSDTAHCCAKNHVSSQTDIWEALCCGWDANWRAFEGWITGPNNGLPLGFMPHHVELMMTWAECLFREVKPYWLWSICDVGCWPSAQIWVRGMESHFYSSTVDPWDLKMVSDFRNGQMVNTNCLYFVELNKH